LLLKVFGAMGVIAFIEDQGGVATAGEIPTLNEWDMILLGLLMAGMAVWGIRRREAQKEH